MKRKPKNIFLHFLNSDTQQIFGFESLREGFVMKDLKKCINASILLCDDDTFCIMPIGFWFESEYTRKLLQEYPNSIESGFIRFSMREENVTEFIEKKREQYSAFLRQNIHNKAYERFFEDDILIQFLDLNPRLIDRKTKVGRNCADLWASNHRILIADNTGDLIQAYMSIDDVSERRKIANAIRNVVLDPEKPFVWGSVKEAIKELLIRDPVFTKELRIQFERNYYKQYLDEYDAVILYQSYIDKGINFMIDFPKSSISSYHWMECYLEYIDLTKLLSIEDIKLVQVKKSRYWRILFNMYLSLCNYRSGKSDDFSNNLLDMEINDELQEAVSKIEEIIMEHELLSSKGIYIKDSKNRKADVLIMVATSDEEKAIINSENWRSEKTKEGYEYFILERKRLTFALAKSFGMGGTKSANATQLYSSHINPRFYAMAGFCAGRKNKVNLGDVFVPEKIYQYGTGKQLSEKDLLPEIESYKLDPLWIQKIERFGNTWRESIKIDRPTTYENQMKRFIEIMEDGNYSKPIHEIRDCKDIPDVIAIINDGCENNYLTMKNGCVTATEAGVNYYKNKYAIEYYGYKEPDLNIKMGALATGDKVQEWVQIFSKLEKEYDRKTYALDMEGFAVADVAWINHVPFIVAKGVGDFASGSKAFDNRYITYATVASFKFLIAFFESLEENEFLGK